MIDKEKMTDLEQALMIKRKLIQIKSHFKRIEKVNKENLNCILSLNKKYEKLKEEYEFKEFLADVEKDILRDKVAMLEEKLELKSQKGSGVHKAETNIKTNITLKKKRNYKQNVNLSIAVNYTEMLIVIPSRYTTTKFLIYLISDGV